MSTLWRPWPYRLQKYEYPFVVDNRRGGLPILIGDLMSESADKDLASATVCHRIFQIACSDVGHKVGGSWERWW